MKYALAICGIIIIAMIYIVPKEYSVQLLIACVVCWGSVGIILELEEIKNKIK